LRVNCIITSTLRHISPSLQYWLSVCGLRRYPDTSLYISPNRHRRRIFLAYCQSLIYRMQLVPQSHLN